VAHAREAYRISESRSFGLIEVSRSTVRCRSRRQPYRALEARLKEWAGMSVRVAGYRPLHSLLWRAGWKVNHKLNERL
jgi:hypothetical protein